MISMRRPLRLLPFIAALVLGLGATTDAWAAQRGAARCRTLGRTLAATEQLRVFEHGQSLDGNSVRYWACGTGDRRAHYLTSRSWDSDAVPVTIGGRFAVFPRRRCAALDDRNPDQDRCRGSIAVYDARSHRTRTAAVAAGGDGRSPYVVSFVVSARGWAAWLAVDQSDYDHQVVWMLPPGRSPQRIAETHAGDYAPAFTALAINGNRLFWAAGDAVGSRLLR